MRVLRSIARGLWHTWFGSVFLSALLASLILWLGQQARSPAAEQRGEILRGVGLGLQLYLFVPSDSGIKEWKDGDYATYSYECSGPRPPDWEIAPDVDFSIVGDTDGHDRYGDLYGRLQTPQYWLRASGFACFRGVRGDDYRLVVPNELRVTQKTPSFHLVEGYFPIQINLWEQLSLPRLQLSRVGEESVRTPAGTIACSHLQGRVTSDTPVIDFWTNSSIPPLGIVRVTLGGETLTLKEFGRRRSVLLDPMVEQLVCGRASITLGCVSCHVDGDPHRLRERFL